MNHFELLPEYPCAFHHKALNIAQSSSTALLLTIRYITKNIIKYLA